MVCTEGLQARESAATTENVHNIIKNIKEVN